MQNLYNLFKDFSFTTWQDLHLNRLYFNAKASETSFTETLVRTLIREITTSKKNIPLRIFHSKKENVNGADLEIVIRLSPDENIILACQAKRLNIENHKKDITEANYERLNHESEPEKGKGKQKQVEHLRKYATDNGAVPLYMFYNYTEQDFPNDIIYPNKELYGCTLVSAEYLYKKYFKDGKFSTVRFKDIHLNENPAKPLVSLAQDINDENQIKGLWGDLGIFNDIGLHNDSDLRAQFWWEELAPSKNDPPKMFVHQLDMNRVFEKITSQKDNLTFNPAFRIIITQEDLYPRKINFKI